MSPNKTTLQAVPKGKPVTHAEVAQLEFRALKQFRNLSKTERIQKIHDTVDRIRPMAVLASELLTKEKPELIALVDEQYDEKFGPFLMQLAHATNDAKALADVIGAAEVRLAAALANIEDDEFAKKVAEEAAS
jgi:hypothetical protein